MIRWDIPESERTVLPSYEAEIVVPQGPSPDAAVKSAAKAHNFARDWQPSTCCAAA
jgi:hypothetical protein